GKSNLALYQYRPPPGVELRVLMLFSRVIVGPADPAPKTSRMRFIESDCRVKSLLGQDCKGEPARCVGDRANWELDSPGRAQFNLRNCHRNRADGHRGASR